MRPAVWLLGSLLAFAVFAAPAGAAAGWHSQQPQLGGGSPPLLGEVGDIECWNGEADRCLLITAGNAGVPAGLFAYDGSGWYRYAKVCGGHGGRIAWAGPDEFWTISDQQAGHAATSKFESAYQRVSLCHFKDGQVVGSYAEPVGSANAYLHMDAAACAGPADCWFAGDRLPATGLNQGAFHLHWDGSALTTIPSASALSELSDPGREVSSLAYEPEQGVFYEGVDVEPEDVPSPDEEQAEEAGLGPSLIHEIEPGGATPFQPLFTPELISFEEPGARLTELEGVRLSVDEGSLWAAAGAEVPTSIGEETLPSVTILRIGPQGPAQLQLSDPAGVFAPGVHVSGLAAELGRDDAWVAFRRPDDSNSGLSAPARVVQVHGDGSLGPEVTLPDAGEEAAGEPVGLKGLAGPIACASAGQCWLATAKGWLFHLGDDPAPNADPDMHPSPPIETRPADDSLPVLPPIELPEDDSGAEEGSKASEQETPVGEVEQLPPRVVPLVAKVKQEVVGDGTVIAMSFTLRTEAKVRLVARRGGRIVAKTPRYTLGRGRHTLRLQLDPKHWPKKLDIEAHKLKRKGSK
jgi:hypothetical protein